MDQLHALHLSSGDSIQVVLPPTTKIFAPLLLANASAIKSVAPQTHSYGPHPRQELDIYHSSASSPSPILIFLHGGGFIRGDKNLEMLGGGGLVYGNLGTFFAKRGIMTVVPNYRRVDHEGGGEGARYPSGGEDVALVMEWIERFVQEGAKGEREVYLCGNSAGGVHVATFLLDEQFKKQRLRYVGTEKGDGSGVVLKGVIELAAPCHFDGAEEGRKGVLETYYGDESDIKEKAICGLLDSVRKMGKGRKNLGIPERMYVATGEFDPDDEIADSMKDFVKLWKETFGDEGLVVKELEGHNHISPAMALMTGDVKAEKWGEDLAAWIRQA